MEGVDVAPVDLGHLHPAERRAEVVLDGDAVVDLRMLALAADVLRQEAFDQVVDGRGPTLGGDLGQRVAAGIDMALSRCASSRAPVVDQSGNVPMVKRRWRLTCCSRSGRRRDGRRR